MTAHADYVGLELARVALKTARFALKTDSDLARRELGEMVDDLDATLADARRAFPAPRAARPGLRLVSGVGGDDA